MRAIALSAHQVARMARSYKSIHALQRDEAAAIQTLAQISAKQHALVASTRCFPHRIATTLRVLQRTQK